MVAELLSRDSRLWLSRSWTTRPPRPDEPDALAVRSGLFSRRRRLVPAETIEQIDGLSGVIGLRVERESIQSFL